jgi:protein PhnA
LTFINRNVIFSDNQTRHFLIENVKNRQKQRFRMGNRQELELKNLENCPQCASVNIYQDGSLWICPECGYEWIPKSSNEVDLTGKSEEPTVKDGNGNILINGDSVVLMKDLRVKGSSGTLKSGTKVKGIRITDEVADHNIAGKIDGHGSIYLKSEFVKKV